MIGFPTMRHTAQPCKRLSEITDGTSNTVFMSEAFRGAARHVADAGHAPTDPYRVMNGATSGISRERDQVTPGPARDGRRNRRESDLAPVVAAHTDWRGGGASGASPRPAWVRSLANNVLTNGYLTPNSRVPDIQFHGSASLGRAAITPAER